MKIEADRIIREVITSVRPSTSKDQPTSVFYNQVLDALNDQYPIVRNRFVQAGMGDYFMIAESIEPDDFAAFPEDSYTINNGPGLQFFHYADLSRHLAGSLPIEQALRVLYASLTAKQLRNQSQSFSRGDIAVRKGSKVSYQALEDIENENTFDKFFHRDSIRSFHPGNGLKYHEGDVIHDHDTQTFYKANFDHINDSDDPVDQIEVNGDLAWEKMFWIEYGQAIIYPDVMPLNRLSMMAWNVRANADIVTSDGKRVFTPERIKQMTVGYIPHFDPVTSPSDKIEVPDAAVSELKMRTAQQVATFINPELAERMEQQIDQQMEQQQQEQEDESPAQRAAGPADQQTGRR